MKVEVVYPFLIEILDDYKKKTITKSELIEMMRLSESYVFRRAICDVPTASLNKTFANITKEIDKDNYLTSVKASFINKKTYQRFPNDDEFKRDFIFKNVYHFRSKPYLFDKLENFEHKEPINTIGEFSVEHIMPQNPNLSSEWIKDLGENWQEIQNKYLHTIGNLTLTGYNSEYSDRSFKEKRTMKRGYADSHLLLNKSLVNLEHWNKEEINKRALELADMASNIWIAPHLPKEILEKYQEIEDDEDDDEAEKKTWSFRLERTEPEVRSVIQELIAGVKEQFNIDGEPHDMWYYFYTGDIKETKNLFAVILCGIGVSNLCFRINPDTFSSDNKLIRTIKGFFFHDYTERRIGIKKDNLDQIMKFLEHSINATKEFSDSKKYRHSQAAFKAWDTRKKKNSN